MSIIAPALHFPHLVPPDDGSFVEVAPGLLWLRLALPFQLNHVNVFLIEDDQGWAVIDTGIADRRTRAVWQDLLRDRLGGRRLSRLIVTHFHPDHVGLAGWLAESCDLELSMSRTEYLMCRNLHQDPSTAAAPAHRAFYLRHGLDAAAADAASNRGDFYLRMTTKLPDSYRRLVAGQTLRIGGRDFDILTGGGHALEQVMLHCRAEKLFLPADQVLARISPNIGVHAWEPDSDPLAEYLGSLSALLALPDDVLVAPAHNLPFRGLHQRIAELMQHHEQRCAEIEAACRARPRTAAELVPVLFPREMDAYQTGFAFAEVLAHVNMMRHSGRLIGQSDPDGRTRHAAA